MPLLRDPHHLHRHYALPGHLRVVERGPDAIQIGVEAPSRVVLRGAPASAAQVLRNLTGHRPLGEVLLSVAGDLAELDVWVDLVDELAALGLVVEIPSETKPDPGRAPSTELAALAARHGTLAGRRVARLRADARVTLLGPEVLTGALHATLTTAGVGEVCLDRTPGPGGGRRGRPAAVDLVVLGTLDVLDAGLAAALTRDGIPHLGVVAGAARIVVGPLVLPGRTSCLGCAHRHRVDADPEWPVVLRYLIERRPPAPPAVAVAMSTALAAAQILDHVDGVIRPATLDGTLEWQISEGTPRRRSWHRHPGCGCGDVLQRPLGAPTAAGGDPDTAGPARATVTMDR